MLAEFRPPGSAPAPPPRTGRSPISRPPACACWRASSGVARGPSRRAGEVDLVLQDRDGTVVFVEVRARSTAAFGGPAASVGHAKQERLRLAARVFLGRYPVLPPCRFDVVAIEGERLEWLKGAFDDGSL